MFTGLRLESNLRASSRHKQSQTYQIPQSYLCPQLAAVVDQGCCGSCYAVALSGCLQDRYNVEHGADARLLIADVLSFDRFPLLWAGCEGGYIGGDRLEAFMHTHGIAIADETDTQTYPACAKPCEKSSQCLSSLRNDYVDLPRVRAPQWLELTSSNAICALLSGRLPTAIEGTVAVGFGVLDSFDRWGNKSWPKLAQPLQPNDTLTLTRAFVPLRTECRKFDQDPDSFHAVCVVGYVTLEDEDFEQTGLGGLYWIVRNSWSTAWGDAGYALMASYANNSSAPFGRSKYAFDSGRVVDVQLPIASAPTRTVQVTASEAEHDTTVLVNAIEETVQARLREDRRKFENRLRQSALYFAILLLILIVGVGLYSVCVKRAPRARSLYSLPLQASTTYY